MGWVVPLIAQHQDDFWLNILAGMPFLLVDIVILTMLLPSVLRWLEERSWKETRNFTLAHVASTYGKTALIVQTLCEIADAFHQRPVDVRALKARVDAVGHQARELLLECHNDVQSSIAILGPRLGKILLTHHFTWADFIRALEEDLAVIGRVDLQTASFIEAGNLFDAYPHSYYKYVDCSETFWDLKNTISQPTHFPNFARYDRPTSRPRIRDIAWEPPASDMFAVAMEKIWRSGRPDLDRVILPDHANLSALNRLRELDRREMANWLYGKGPKPLARMAEQEAWLDGRGPRPTAMDLDMETRRNS